MYESHDILTNILVDACLIDQLAHSLCHLLGYDHEDEDEHRVMEAKEMDLLRKWKELRATLAKENKAALEAKKDAKANKEKLLKQALKSVEADSVHAQRKIKRAIKSQLSQDRTINEPTAPAS